MLPYFCRDNKTQTIMKTKGLKIFLSSFAMVSMMSQAQVSEPKNIIFLIGDGMSYNTITATNYYTNGEDLIAPFQKFPVSHAMSTYNGTSMQEYRSDSAWISFKWVAQKGNYTDSAPAATAFSTGKKTYDGAIGVDMNKNNLTHFMEYAKEIGKSAGVVSSVQFSHATPAAHVAHNENRNNYSDIANEMLNSDMDVIIGAGHPDYDDNANARSQKEYKYVGGESTWEQLVAGKLNNWSFTDDSAKVAEYANGKNLPERLVVVPKVASTLQQGRKGDNVQVPYADSMNKGVNSLAELSTAALNVLAQNEKGFVVMIEGGAIDWANHANQKGRMIEEQIDFNKTVDAVIKWVEANGGWENNLVVVTSDHECGYLLGEKDGDNKFTTNPIVNNGKGNVPGMKYNSGDHTNMLVPVYAKGAGAEVISLFADRVDPLRGQFIDNTEIAQTFFLLWQDVAAGKQIKNVIYMVSDGWGENQIKATNYYMGEEQAFESFPTKMFMSTYHGMGKMGSKEIADYFTSYNSELAWANPDYIDIKPTDSAPAATAMGTGKKTYDGSINMSTELEKMETLAEVAKAKGKAAGVISSVEFSHATPAAFGAAHNLSRNEYAEIANEMLLSKLDLIMGAGHPEYDDNGQPRENKEYQYVGGETTWNALKEGTLNNRNFTDDRARIEEIAAGNNIPENLVFVAKAATTLQQARAGEDKNTVNFDNFNQSVPSLKDMAKASLNILNKDNDGFFLMIEGGAIDWANHANEKGRLIEEQNDFNKSVDAVIEWVEENSNWDETLLIVTGDHETGYLGGEEMKDLGKSTIKDNGKGVMPGMKYYSGNHTNQLIPFYAKGACADALVQLAGNHDKVRGYYIENTQTAMLTKLLWGQLDDSSTGIENAESSFYQNDNLKVICNDGEATIITPSIEGKAVVRIIDITGKVIMSQDIMINSDGQATISTGDNKGIFFIALSQGNRTYTAKCMF